MNFWSVEHRRLAILLVIVILVGFVSGYWALTIIAALIAYIGWMWLHLYRLHHWIATGSKKKNIPENSGIWQRFIHHIHDSERKNKKQKRKLAALLKQFNVTLASLPDAIIILNAQHQIEWANPTSERLLGINIKFDMGQRLLNLVRLPELQALLEKRDFDHELEIANPRDEQQILGLRLIGLRHERLLITARDISQRIQLQETRRHFVANASHELRTPLTVISGYLEILQQQPSLPDNLQQATQNALDQATRMNRIIDDLLTLSKLENNQLRENEGKSINIPELLRGLVEDIRAAMLIEQDDLLTLELDNNLYLYGIESEIHSVCSNLIQNAIKHTPEGTQIRIIWYLDERECACLSVIDNGPGIDPRHIQHLTERFYRVDPGRSRERGGTGLGLSIVKHIVQRHGGEFKISSDPSGSHFMTCFTFHRTQDRHGK